MLTGFLYSCDRENDVVASDVIEDSLSQLKKKKKQKTRFNIREINYNFLESWERSDSHKNSVIVSSETRFQFHTIII